MKGASNTAGLSVDRVPPRLAGQPKRRPAPLAAILLAAAGAAAVLFFCDPARHQFYPICYFHAVTGLNCPGCGSLRALHELLHGHLLPAARSNVLLLLLLLVLGGAGLQRWVTKHRLQSAVTVVRPGWLWAFLGTAVVFAVLRNLPAFRWLAP